MAGDGRYVEGVDATKRALRGLAEDADDLDLWQEVARDAEEIVTRAAPASSGALRRALRGVADDNRARVIGDAARVPYLPVQNYGAPRIGIRGIGFMQRADDLLANALPDRVAAALRTSIERNNLT